MQPLFHVELANAGLTAAYRPLLTVATKKMNDARAFGTHGTSIASR